MSKTASELKKECETLELDKDRLDEWFMNKTKEIDVLQKKEQDIHEKAIIERKELEKQREELKNLKTQITSETQGLERKKIELEKGLLRLEEDRKSGSEFFQTLNQREESIFSKERAILDREKFVNEIFSGIEKLKVK